MTPVFKIAYCAGHYLGTSGKRVPKALDKNQTREWTLNDRVARYFNLAALEYEGVATLRTDDSTGQKDVKIKNRTAKANDWGADVYIDMHHNAGINLGKGGGVVAISKKKDAKGKTYRDAIYSAVVAAGGLKGNRSNPTYEKNFDTMVYSKCPAVIIEYGFMDSKTDYPIISTEEYAKKVAYATMEAVAEIAGLKKKTSKDQVENKVCELKLRVLKNGENGDDVKAMQVLLEASGCKGKMDANKYGSFGSKTESSVKSYQKKVGLPQTGQCDHPTWKKLLGVSI